VAGRAAKHMPWQPFRSHGAEERLNLLRRECFDGLALVSLSTSSASVFSIAMECAKAGLGITERGDYFGAQINARLTAAFLESRKSSISSDLTQSIGWSAPKCA
jgi:hypothetical protein